LSFHDLKSQEKVREFSYERRVGTLSQSYGASRVITHHTVFPATLHRCTHPALTPAIQARTWLTCPGGMEGWVDVGGGYIRRWFTCVLTVIQPCSNHLIATRPGVELTAFWS